MKRPALAVLCCTLFVMCAISSRPAYAIVAQQQTSDQSSGGSGPTAWNSSWTVGAHSSTATAWTAACNERVTATLQNQYDDPGACLDACVRDYITRIEGGYPWPACVSYKDGTQDRTACCQNADSYFTGCVMFNTNGYCHPY